MSLTPKKRFEIMHRDHFTCWYCGAKPPNVALEVDHYQAKALGGTDDDFNLITACTRCNAGKSDEEMHTGPCSIGCQRPRCGGPRRGRDELEGSCECECHQCAYCDDSYCRASETGNIKHCDKPIHFLESS